MVSEGGDVRLTSGSGNQSAALPCPLNANASGPSLAITRLGHDEAKNMRQTITPILYVIIAATITLLYADFQNIALLKHPLTALYSLSPAQDEADDADDD